MHYKRNKQSCFTVYTHPSVEAVTIATFPSSLRLAAAVELILRDLQAPKNTPGQQRFMLQAFVVLLDDGFNLVSLAAVFWAVRGRKPLLSSPLLSPPPFSVFSSLSRPNFRAVKQRKSAQTETRS